ncbi:MAG: hypothetical protein QE271_05580 [Bacteriovoracaceae bacterium]|nr:hypothetical protein [Bacteriovoracaceae bacterium]
MDEKIKKILNKQKVISLADATKVLGNSKKVYRLVEAQMLKQVHPKGMGLFTLLDIEEGEAQFAAVTKYFPQCVISGITALSLYRLGDDFIREIHVDIPNSTNITNTLIRAHRVHPKKIFDVELRAFPNVPIKIKIYSPERTLFEAYKQGDSSETYYKAIKKYRRFFLDKKKPAVQYEKIRRVDEILGVRILRDIIMEDVHG